MTKTKAQMSIGTPIANIPSVRRKHQAMTRLDMVRKAANKVAAGLTLPVYMVSNTAANSLATLLRRDPKTKAWKVAVRKHIVYVQKPLSVETQESETLSMSLAPELTEVQL